VVCAPFGLGYDGGGVMAADVKEATQYPVASSHYEDRLAGDIAGDKLTRFANLIQTPHHLPRASKDRAGLQPEDPRFHVPWRWNRPGLGER
jgi:hypothetical protein